MRSKKRTISELQKQFVRVGRGSMIRCGTFRETPISPEIKAKMVNDREKAESKADSQPACVSVKHRMMLAGVFKKCPICGEEFKEKPPNYLLRSHDGVDMYKGDLLYYTMNLKTIHHCTIPIRDSIYFSSHEAAQEYIDS